MRIRPLQMSRSSRNGRCPNSATEVKALVYKFKKHDNDRYSTLAMMEGALFSCSRLRDENLRTRRIHGLWPDNDREGRKSTNRVYEVASGGAQQRRLRRKQKSTSPILPLRKPDRSQVDLHGADAAFKWTRQRSLRLDDGVEKPRSNSWVGDSIPSAVVCQQATAIFGRHL